MLYIVFKLGIQKFGIILDCKVPLNQKLAKMSQVKVVHLKLILSIENHFSGNIYWDLRVKIGPKNSNAVNNECFASFQKKKNTCGTYNLLI